MCKYKVYQHLVILNLYSNKILVFKFMTESFIGCELDPKNVNTVKLIIF